MHEIVCVGDVHEGLSFDFRIDPETGISERALDLHGNFAKAAAWASEHGAALFCILGDLFDRAHVAPVFREMVRRDVIEPVGDAGIEVWILAGNHDQPRRAVRSTSLDDYRGYAHVKVFRDPKMEVRDIDGRRIGFILIPYIHPEQVVEQVRGTLAKDVPRELAYEAARRTWQEWIRNRAQDLKDADLRILFGHFEFQGVRYASTAPTEVVPNDFTFTADMIPDAIDLVVFEVTLPDELRNRLDEKRLADRLRDAFHYEVKFISASRPRVVSEEFTLDPGRLLADYVDKVLADHPKREAIKVEARRVLKEALA